MSEGKVSVSSAIKGMFSFFTILPINIGEKNIESMNRKFWIVPIVGLFYAILATVVFVLTFKYLAPAVAAALTIAIVGITNRFLHFDGLIDFGDGLVVAGKREDHVRALKDTLVGAGGVATGIVVTLLLFAEYLSLDAVGFMFLGFSAELMARNAQVAAAAFGEPGNGMAGDSVRYTNKASLLKSSVLSIVLIAVSVFAMRYIAVEGFGWTVSNLYIYAPIVAFVVSIVWGWLISAVAKKNFGIVNGDVLGAVNETSRVVTLFAMILFVSLAGMV